MKQSDVFSVRLFHLNPFCGIILSDTHEKGQEPLPTKVCVPALTHAMADGSATDKDMITVITEKCNEISQELYNDLMDSIQVCQMECSCGHCGCLVPYSQVPLADHAAIASSYEEGKDGMEVMDRNPELSPSQVFYILSLYLRFWQQRLLSERLLLSPLHALTQDCIRLFGRQFMQIKTTRNLLFVPPT